MTGGADGALAGLGSQRRVTRQWGAIAAVLFGAIAMPEAALSAADSAGLRPAVWNVRARHGGVSEAVDAGVSDLDLGKHAQHSSIQTTFRHYMTDCPS